ncbi:hypothetical protein [Thorsellia anophelis]|uniref:Uncharacterized protein n=1 Tax=Thorsellia anophelis DSM 18579 TaxID=1123402 RepID=A0A1I0FAL5_9GAMM|nr:hypothetical protein [Thorsellia anophelis]SET55176.1 hypothetical protein SAMN02583745_02700 [Thorsellia anophelis DSM 18579]
MIPDKLLISASVEMVEVPARELFLGEIAYQEALRASPETIQQLKDSLEKNLEYSVDIFHSENLVVKWSCKLHKIAGIVMKNIKILPKLILLKRILMT